MHQISVPSQVITDLMTYSKILSSYLLDGLVARKIEPEDKRYSQILPQFAIKFEVLNGSDVVGEAGFRRASDCLSLYISDVSLLGGTHGGN